MIFPAVSADYIIDLYHRYLSDPSSVDPSWKPYFDELWGRAPVLGGSRDVALEVAAARLTDAYRGRGHMAADLDPLGLWQRTRPPELDPAFFGIDATAMDREIQVPPSLNVLTDTPRGLLAHLREVYTGSIGFDCAHVDDAAARAWLYAAAPGRLVRVNASRLPNKSSRLPSLRNSSAAASSVKSVLALMAQKR